MNIIGKNLAIDHEMGEQTFMRYACWKQKNPTVDEDADPYHEIPASYGAGISRDE